MLRYASTMVAAVTLGMVTIFAAPVHAQTTEKPLVLKGQSTHPASSNFHLIFKLWAETVEKMTAGRLKIETLPAGAIVPAFEVFDATSKNVLDVGMGPFGYILGRNTATIPMSHGPLFGMDGSDYWAWYYDGGGMKLLDEFYRDVLKLNVVGFPIPTDYPQGMGWFKKEINSLADLKGMKYRIYGIGAETYGRLGVSVVTIPGGEIVPAMERGVIEGAEWINCEEDKKLGLHQVAKHYYTPGMHEPVTGGQLMINGDVWKKLTPDLQEIIKVASVYATTHAQLRLQSRDGASLPGPDQDGRADASHARRDPEELPRRVGEDPGRARGEEPLLQESHRQPEGLCRTDRALQAVLVPALQLCRRVLLEEQDLPDQEVISL